jgi:serine/threonine protein kinase/tetratricopeptide (TPR) repeat protein
MIGLTISHYRIVSKLGEGGMGVVYIAEDILLGRRVAIKTAKCKPDDHAFRHRFLREARAVSAFSHPHIATIYDYGETDGQPYIVMELIEGRTLSDLLMSGTLTFDETLTIIKQVAEALSEAHRHGIVHRDIKPSNIAITDRGVVKVLDFGLAKQINVEPLDIVDPNQFQKFNTQTREGVIVGTPSYFSPEQALGLQVDARSDLFSLGSVFYECITGSLPFSGSSPIEISAKVIRDDPALPSSHNPSIPPGLDRIILKWLAKKPEERYQSMADLMADLSSLDVSSNGSTVGVQTTTSEVAHGQTEEAKANETHETQERLLHAIRTVVTNVRSRIPVKTLVRIAVIIIAVVTVLAWEQSWKGKSFSEPSSTVQRAYDDAVEQIHEGAFFRASVILERAVKEGGDSFPLMHARLAEAYAELDNSEKATAQLLRVRELVPDPGFLEEIDRLRLDAITAMVKRDFASAIKSYEALVSITPAPEKQHALIDLGRALEKSDQLSKAIDYYEQALTLDQSPAAHLRLGIVYGRGQRVDDAFNSFDKAYGLFDISGGIEGMAEVSLQRAVLLGQLGETEQAHDELIKALDKSNALDNKDKAVRVLLNLSNNELVAGRPAPAEQYSNQAISLAQQNNMENLTIQGIIDIANTHFVRGQYKEAEANYQQAIRLAQYYKANRNQARANLMMASLRNHQNDPEGTREFVEKALPFYQQGGYRKELSTALSILGHAYDQAGLYNLAILTFQQQLELAKQVDDQLQVAQSTEGLGVVYNHQQNYPKALEQFSRQYDIAKKLRNETLVAYAAMNRGPMLWQLGNYEDGTAALDEAQLRTENKELIGWVRVSKARMALSQGDTKKAISESSEVIKITGTERKAITIQALSTLGVAEALNGRVTFGVQQCGKAVDLAKSLRDPLPLSHSLLALSHAAYIAKDFEKALATAQEAQARFASAAQYEAEWRAWALIARINPTSDAGDKANARLSMLKIDWQFDNNVRYLLRPDISELLKVVQPQQSALNR